jgi:hypothetical protein
MKSTTFWDITPCRLVEVKWPRLWSRYISQVNQQNWGGKQLMKSTVISYGQPCSLVDIHWSVGGIYCLHRQGRNEVKRETDKKQVASRDLWHPFLVGLTALQLFHSIFVRSLNKSGDKIGFYTYSPLPFLSRVLLSYLRSTHAQSLRSV